MAKQTASDRPTSSSAESHGLLRGLIDALHQLVVMISSRLRHTQIHRSPMGDIKGDYDIWKRLGSQLEQISEKSQPDTKSPRSSEETAADSSRRQHMDAKVQESSELTEHSKRRAVNQLLPRMSEQLHSKTMEHINISLIQAKQGNSEGARLHIDLAQSAMHTASRFMSHEEYEIFEQKVEHRLKSIIDAHSVDDSGA